MSNFGIEKALAAGLEPLVEAICDLEKKVELLQVAVEKATREKAEQPSAEPLRIARR